MPASAVVNIKRPKKYLLSFFTFDIYLDGQKVTSIRNGKPISLEVMPGFHRLHCQFGKKQSETVEWHAVEGQQLSLECEPIDWPMYHFYCGSLAALLLWIAYAYGFWGLHWLYSRDMNKIFMCLCVFVQFGGLMWSTWLHDKQWGKQKVHLLVVPESQTVSQILSSPSKEQHDHPFYLISILFITAIGFPILFDYYIYVLLPVIFP